MWNAIKEMLSSKKALTMVLSVAVWVLARFGLQLDVADILPIVGPMWGYIFGQAYVDGGKSKALVEAAMVREVRSSELTTATAPDPT